MFAGTLTEVVNKERRFTFDTNSEKDCSTSDICVVVIIDARACTDVYTRISERLQKSLTRRKGNRRHVDTCVCGNHYVNVHDLRAYTYTERERERIYTRRRITLCESREGGFFLRSIDDMEKHVCVGIF